MNASNKCRLTTEYGGQGGARARRQEQHRVEGQEARDILMKMPEDPLTSVKSEQVVGIFLRPGSLIISKLMDSGLAATLMKFSRR